MPGYEGGSASAADKEDRGAAELTPSLPQCPSALPPDIEKPDGRLQQCKTSSEIWQWGNCVTVADKRFLMSLSIHAL